MMIQHQITQFGFNSALSSSIVLAPCLLSDYSSTVLYPFGKVPVFVLQQSSLSFSCDCLSIQHFDCLTVSIQKQRSESVHVRRKNRSYHSVWCSTRVLCCGIRIPICVLDTGCPSQVLNIDIPISSIFHAMATNQRSRAEYCNPHNYSFCCKT